jgi:NADPH:quinone reductase-like Zn-dependent oxidoreductase
MNAVGVFEFGGPEQLKVVELPEPEPGEGEIRIRVHAASVNMTDILFRRGSQAARLTSRKPPYVPGMDVAGIVDKLGTNSEKRFAIGDRVIAYVVPAGPHGGAYAEKLVVPAASAVAAPAGATLYEAATLLLNAITARLALDALALQRGQTVAITGAAGAVGGYAIQLGKADGLKVIGDSGSPSDEALLRSLGADHVVTRGTGFTEGVRTVLPAGAQGLVDGAHMDALALGAIAGGGGFATVRGWAGPSDRGIVIHTIISPTEAQNTPLLDRMRRHVENKLLTLRVAAIIPAAHAASAHRRLEAGGVRGRLVLDFQSPLVAA